MRGSGLLCLGRTPTGVSSSRCSPVSRGCGYSRLLPRRGWGPGPCAPSGSPATCWSGPPQRSGSITDEDLAVLAGRRHAQGHPEAGSALYRNLILPEMGRSGPWRRTVSGGSPSPPSRSWGAPIPVSGRAMRRLRRPSGRPRRPHHRWRGTLPGDDRRRRDARPDTVWPCPLTDPRAGLVRGRRLGADVGISGGSERPTVVGIGAVDAYRRSGLETCLRCAKTSPASLHSPLPMLI